MGRPKGSKNKRQGASQPPPPPPTNGSDPETIVTFASKFHQALDEIEEAKKPYDSAQARFRTLRKAAIASHVDVENLIAIVKFERLNPEAFREQAESRLRIAQILNLPIGTQMALIPPMSDVPQNVSVTVKLNHLERAGYKVGKAGGNRSENNQIPGTPEFVSWDNGYMRGQKMLVVGAAPAATPGATGRGPETGSFKFDQMPEPEPGTIGNLSEKAFQSHAMFPRRKGSVEGFRCRIMWATIDGEFIAGFDWKTKDNGGGGDYTPSQRETRYDNAIVAQRFAAQALKADLVAFIDSAGEDVPEVEKGAAALWRDEIDAFVKTLGREPLMASAKEAAGDGNADEDADQGASDADLDGDGLPQATHADTTAMLQ